MEYCSDKISPILSYLLMFWFLIDCLHTVLLGALNDRLLLGISTDINVRQKKKFEIKNCLIGLLEPLLIGYATMQQYFEQKLDLSEVLYQITSRFFCCFTNLIWGSKVYFFLNVN